MFGSPGPHLSRSNNFQIYFKKMLEKLGLDFKMEFNLVGFRLTLSMTLLEAVKRKEEGTAELT